LRDDAKGKRESNGFVIIPWYGDDIIQPYKTLKKDGLPIFVTSDTLLHLYLIQFDKILMDIEEKEFFDAVFLDVMAVPGSESAEEILVEECKDARVN
jgi:hypothetical protein